MATVEKHLAFLGEARGINFKCAMFVEARIHRMGTIAICITISIFQVIYHLEIEWLGHCKSGFSIELFGVQLQFEGMIVDSFGQVVTMCG